MPRGNNVERQTETEREKKAERERHTHIHTKKETETDRERVGIYYTAWSTGIVFLVWAVEGGGGGWMVDDSDTAINSVFDN